jgi:uncharacterized lipoprotein YmbA
VKRVVSLLVSIIVVQGCVSRQPDHLYVLEPQPAGAREARTEFDRQVALRVTVPSVVDRAQMVVTTSTGVAILEHERWAAPLADLVTSTLGQDIERRRNDVVVVLGNAESSTIPLVTISVTVAQLTARLGQPVSMEARWRVTDVRSGKVALGREVFISPSRAGTYSDIATAVSSCVGLLADRLTQEMPGG